MKRIYFRLVLGLFISLFFVGFIPNVANAGVEDFNFSSYDADFYLSKDSSGHSVMKVVERYTAEFNNLNQNKGIVKAIPADFDGHSVSFHLISLTRNGQSEPIFEQKKSGGYEIVSTGTNEYVNGTQKYIFTYTLSDVTKVYGDNQELFWDTNGTGSVQSFDSVTARVHLDDSVISDFTGETQCYQGPANSNEKCDSKVVDDVATFNSTRALGAHENLTMSVVFKSGTFADYSATIADFIPLILIGLAVIAFIIIIIIKFIYGRNNPGKGTIVPEYLPPKNTSVLMSAEIFDKPKNSVTAQIIDFAVRHKIRIEETEKDAFIGKTKEYSAELLSVEGLNLDELGLIYALFGGEKIGAKYIFKKDDVAMGIKTRAIVESTKKESKKIGYRVKQTPISVAYLLVILVMFTLVGFAIYISLNGPNAIAAFFGFVLIGLFAVLFFPLKLGNINPLTANGRELFDYLKGLKMYIKLAEKERLRVLQSIEGADRKQINTGDNAEMVVLYERVLPYAVLFGQEKSWLKHLGAFYENNQMRPDWYSGMGTFNAVAFASSVGSFSSFAGSNSFSSTGGAGGGGFSGGGGGGGGVGGR